MSKLADSEAIFIFDDKGISNEMLYQEFEAFLDGMIGMSDFAGKNTHVAYANIDAGLNISSLVFFTLAFDKKGMADSKWNVPLRSLAEKGIEGPDLGAGPVKIFMKDGNESGAYAKYLWTPVERGGKNDLLHIMNAVKRNRLCLAVDLSTVSKAEPTSPAERAENVRATVVAQAAATPIAPAAASSVLVNPAPIDNDEFSQMIRIIESQRIKITALENELVKGMAQTEIAKEYSALQQEFDALQAEKPALEKQLKDTLAESGKLQKAVAKLEEKLAAQSEKFGKEKTSLTTRSENEQKSEKEKLEKHYNKIIQKREMEIEQRFSHQIKQAEEDSKLKELQMKNLNSELTQLRGDKFRLMKSGAGDFFEKIAAADVSFMTFKPGAGHLTIPLQDMSRFIENTNAYIAGKCNVSTQEYEVWLQHYQKPVCNAPLPGGTVCGDKVTRMEAPAGFKPGGTDRCKKHFGG